MLSVAAVFPEVLVISEDLVASEKRVMPKVEHALRGVGEAVLQDARRRFIEYGGGQNRFVVSAQGMEKGVAIGVGHGVVSVGQTLPRATSPERRRPLWSLLQYEHALGPALDYEEMRASDEIADGAIGALAEFGFVP